MLHLYDSNDYDYRAIEYSYLYTFNDMLKKCSKLRSKLNNCSYMVARTYFLERNFRKKDLILWYLEHRK